MAAIKGYAVVKTKTGASVAEMSTDDTGERLPAKMPDGRSWWKWSPKKATADKIAADHNARLAARG